MPNREMEQEDFEQQREEVARLAHSYWQSRGCIDGHDMEDWLMAEQEVLSRRKPRREEQRKEARTAA